MEGYRNMYLWAVIPVKKEPWTPQTFQARVAQSAKFMKVDDWKSGMLRRADSALKYDWPAFDWLTPGMKPTATPFWGQSYRCPDCKDPTLQSDPPNEIKRHVCPKCKKVIENDPYFDQCMRQEYFRHRFADIRALAMAWLLTGDAKYADKALAIMLAYSVRRLPYAVRACVAALEQVHASLEEAAQNLGAPSAHHPAAGRAPAPIPAAPLRRSGVAELVFYGERKSRVRRHVFRPIWRDACHTAGVESIRLEWRRHTGASIAYAATHDLKATAARLYEGSAGARAQDAENSSANIP